MALDSVHPMFTEMSPDWEKARDVYKGERHVKEKGAQYLPPTQGMRIDGFGKAVGTPAAPNAGQDAYDAYRVRAIVPDAFEDAVEYYIGMLHSQPAVIELPPAMEKLRESATSLGEPLELLLRRINEEQLVTGRLGLLLDLPETPDPANPLPYIALYVAEAGRNWDDDEIGNNAAKLNMVVLDESGYKRDGFEWNWVSKYRVLQLGALQTQADGTPLADGKKYYSFGVFENDGQGAPEYSEISLVEPTLRGQKLEEIPFVFVNSKDIVASPDKPPLLTLVNLCMAIYRGDADYRQNLFMQGQDTLVTIGDRKGSLNSDPNELQASRGRGNELNTDMPVRTGAGSMIEMDAGGDVKYVGVQSQGLAEQRESQDALWSRAAEKAGKLSTSTNNGLESGEALKTRIGAQTATLNQIALTGAAALEWLLKLAARWMGQDENAVKVVPNLEFSDFQMDGTNLASIVVAKTQGAPLSKESLHALMVEGGLTKMTYEEEKALLDKEAAEAPPLGTTAGGNPDATLNPAQQNRQQQQAPKPAPSNAPADKNAKPPAKKA